MQRYERSDDPLVQLWRDTKRPLNWHPWRHLNALEQAHMRFLLIDEMQVIEAQVNRLGEYHWRQAHRELLELKAAYGHGTEKALTEEETSHAS